ncbi:T9SS type A sorting domain-containing protein, partial [Dyadobacter subterraneus]
TPAALSATALAGNTLKWWGNDASGGTSSSATPTPSTATAGTVIYYVSQVTTATGCESPRAMILVTVNACTTAAPTVSNVTYCLSETPVALTATGTALKWYSVATGGTALASAPIPVTTTAGTTSYYVSQTLNGCEGIRAKIDVIVNPLTPAPTVTALVTYCLSETPSALTATGTGLKWYTVATGGTALAAAPTPVTTTAGTISYYVSQTINGCEGTRAKIDVTVNPQTAAPTVTATIKYCFNATTTALTATGTTLQWYTAATGGTALSAAPTPSATTAGTTSYYVSQTLNGCEGTRAKIDVIISPQVAAPAITTSALEYCQSVKAPALSATPLAGATLNWYGTNATGGTASAAAPVPSTDTEGTVTYYVGQTDANGCTSARAAISVKTNVTPKPTLATSSVAYCQNEVAPALVATGTNLKWYLTIDDTSPRTTALIPYTAKVDDYSFYVTQTGTNNCESAKAEIKVHIKPLPSATISGNSSIPLGGTANVTINFTGDAPWSYILSNGSSATTSSATLSIPVSPTVTTTYVVTEVSNSCGKGIINGSALVTVQIPTLTIGVPSVSESCAGKTFTVQFQQSGSFPDGSTMKAQISTVNETSKFISIPSVISGNVITATIPDTTVKGTYYIRIANIGKDGSLIAAGNVSSGQITVNPLPVATISGATTIYMGATTNLKVDLTGNAPWTFSLNNGLTDSLVSTSVNPIIVKVIPKATTTYTISKVSNQCGTGRGAGSARIQVDPVLGTEPPVVSGDWLKIYPTLVDSKCTVEITSAVSAKEAEVEILDLNGRSLYKRSINQKITEVDFSQRPAGLYLLKVQNGKYNSVQRILKP